MDEFMVWQHFVWLRNVLIKNASTFVSHSISGIVFLLRALIFVDKES